jgi:hypothetical protein
MNRTIPPDLPRPDLPRSRKTGAPKPRAEIAAALFAAALTLFALADMPPRAPAPTAVVAVPVPAEPAPAPLHSASYYPEHLAALQSLSGFQPMADEGEKPAVSPVALAAPAKPALLDPKKLLDPRAPRRRPATPAGAPRHPEHQRPARATPERDV